MANEEKQLLLKDLCGRLPYGVMCEYTFMDGRKTDMVFKGQHFDHEVMCKPYLRPMESMTEEEEKELSKILNYEFYVDDDFGLVAEDDRHRIRLELCEGYIDWLDKKMFDYRGLIPMGLALEAPKDMYKI